MPYAAIRGWGTTQLTERFYGAVSNEEGLQDETAELLRDIAWLSEARLKQVKTNPASFPEAAFTTFCRIYGEFLELGTLRPVLTVR